MEFVSAPFQVPGEGESSRNWWFTQNDSFSSRDAPDECKGLENSVKVVEDAWRDLGPFDGLFGFSQGACLVSLLSAMCQQGLTTLSPRFVVIVSGFKSKCKAHDLHYQEQISLPSLHVMGETDEVIPVAWSQDLASAFTGAQVLKHSGGHFVPGTSSLKSQYLEFFENYKSTK